jgi:hypothetical protein
VTVPKRHATLKDNRHLKAGEALEDLPEGSASRVEKGDIKDAKNVIIEPKDGDDR